MRTVHACIHASLASSSPLRYLKEGVTPTTAKICFVKHADRRQQPTAYADAQVKNDKAHNQKKNRTRWVGWQASMAPYLKPATHTPTDARAG